nr:carboxypeptidase regulatory-like domain-containing protein [Deltaproteobacteria bacterium]
MRASWVGRACVAALVSCSDPTEPPRDAGATADRALVDSSMDANADAEVGSPEDSGPSECPAGAVFATGSEQGAADPARVPSGQARAGRLTAAQLPVDRTGLGTWQEGDYVVANNRVALLIESARPSSGYMPSGGLPVGVTAVRDGRLVDAGDFGEVAIGLGRFTMHPASVTVTHDGRDGAAAVVRATGPMRAIPFIAEFGYALAPADYADITAAIDYELRGDSDVVEIYITFDVPRLSATTVRMVLNGFFQGNRMGRFVPDRGFMDGTGSMAATPLVGWVDDRAMSWAWMLPPTRGNLTPIISVAGFDMFTAPALTFPPCSQTRVHFGRIALGGPGLDGLQRAIAASGGVTLRRVDGTVADTAGQPSPGARVHVTSLDGTRYLDRVTADATGRFGVHVPAGPVRLVAWRSGSAPTAAVEVAGDASEAALVFPLDGSIAVEATDALSGEGLPVRVQVIPVGASPRSLPASHGEPATQSGRLHVAYPTDGRVTLPAPPGVYRVVVSGGPFYDLSDTRVTVAAGMTARVPVTLRRVVTTPGVLCGDFHVHTIRSPDSDDDARLKLAAGVADDLSVMARSDHEWVMDFQPLIEEMGLTRYVRGVGSIEMTTFTFGHFGVFPLNPDPSRHNNGDFAWANRLPSAVFADVRARPERPTLVINHPRGAPPAAYFDAAGYSAADGTANPAMWDEGFTAVEFFNGSSFEQNATLVTDWFSFLRRGRRVFAVGSSDSHHLSASPVGYPRTCMFLGTSDPSTVSPQAIGTAVGAGRSTISGGIFLDVRALPATGEAGAAGPGQEITGVGAEARVEIVVRAPTWVRADRLQVFVDGTAMPTLALDDAARDPGNPVVRYRGTVRVPVAAGGSWVVVAAHGQALEPVFPGRMAFAVSNPIFLRR